MYRKIMLVPGFESSGGVASLNPAMTTIKSAVYFTITTMQNPVYVNLPVVEI